MSSDDPDTAGEPDPDDEPSAERLAEESLLRGGERVSKGSHRSDRDDR